MIGSLIKAYRTQERYSVRQLAKLLKISAATLSRVENGKAMDQKTMLILTNWLFGGKR